MFKLFYVKILLVLLLFIFTSCSIDGTFQGLFSYYKVTKKESNIQFIHFDDISDCSSLDYDSAKVLLADGVELRRCLEKYENSIVYVWSPKCRSQYCYPLNIIQKTCKQEDVELFVVAEYYDSYYMSRYYGIQHPLIGIDIKHYKTNLTSRYFSKFVVDLTNGKYKGSSKSEGYCRFLEFNKGKFEDAFETIEQINKN